jgi:predicted GH43/DUF377 family glycosyl hydrolase
MKRFQGNPILEPIGTHTWESRRVFNAAVLSLDKRIHILYRAMGDDNISRLGYAASSDGYHIDERLPLPIFEPTCDVEKDGCEDPRLTLLDDRLIMAYTAFGSHSSQWVYQVSLTSIAVKDFLAKRWAWGERRLVFPGIRNKDAAVFPRKFDRKYIMFHRLEPDICIARSDDLHRWFGLKFIMGPRAKSWDCWKVGAAGTPIELNEGWLFIYHGVNFDKIYSLGVALLNKENPEEILYRSEEPILTPMEDYERLGKVPNVVFSCGNVLMDDQVFVYYGGADTVLCVATYDLCELLPKK